MRDHTLSGGRRLAGALATILVLAALGPAEAEADARAGTDVADGLVVQLEADRGVAVSGGVVTGWADQSGRGNDLAAVGGPTLSVTPSGSPAIAFDGVSAALERTGDLAGLPAGGADRSMFVVVRYDSVGWGGVAYGDPSCGGAFGAVVNRGGRLAVQGWCADVVSKSVATGAGWLVQSVVLDDGVVRLFRDGVMVASKSQDYATVLSRLVVGAELDSHPFVEMQVASVLVYDRALSDGERQQVETSLQAKWLLSDPTPTDPPLARDDAGMVSTGGTVSIDVLANDEADVGTLDPASLVIVTPPTQGSASVVDGRVTYVHDGSTGSSDSFTYTVADTAGNVSNVANVVLSVSASPPPPPPPPPLALPDSASVATGAAVAIDVLANDNANGGVIDPGTVLIATSPAAGSAQISDGRIVYQHDGSEVTSDTFTYTVANTEGSRSDPASVSISVAGGFSQQVVLEGLEQPISMAFLPDGRLLVLEKTGAIRITDPSQTPATSEPYLVLSDVLSNAERGLTDITLDPDFSENGHFYLYYSTASAEKFRVSRFTHLELEGGLSSRGDLASEVLVWENPSQVQRCCHFGGGLDFGPDGKLYLTTGEMFEGGRSQDLTLPDGKILRFNADGTVPPDNPFVDGPGGNADEVWAFGLRNPFRARWDAPGNRLLISDVGGNDDDTAYEEINLGIRGANYGWPACEGLCGTPGVQDPLFTYPHAGQGKSVTGGVVYRGSQFPSTFVGAYFYGDYVRRWIRYLTFDTAGNVVGDHEFATGIGSVVSIEQGPNGALYWADIAGGRLHRFVYGDGNRAPVVLSAEAAPTSGAAPLAAQFSGAAVDPDGDPLTYRWVFGDGARADGATAAHTYQQEGSFTAVLEVSDGARTTISEPVMIQVGPVPVPPVATITGPVDGVTFRAGDTITFAGSGISAEGPLDPDRMSWHVRFLHNEHFHPVLGPQQGSGGSFTIDTSGHDYSSNTRYEIELTVTDVRGATDTARVVVFPEKVDLTFQTVPPGIGVVIDEIPRATPFAWDALIGFSHTVSATSATCLGGRAYVFDGWAHGQPSTHTLAVPEGPATYTATYVDTGACGGVPVTGGLVVQLEADRGVAVSGGVVTGWADQSGRGNDLAAVGGPTLSVTPSGSPAIAFDGVSAALERTGDLAGLPAGGADRSMFVVVRYDSVGWGGVAYGDPSCGGAFGAVVNRGGRLAVQGWCADVVSKSVATGAGWLVQSVVLDDGVVRLFRDGVMVASKSQDYATVLSRLVVGAELDSHPFVEMQVASVLVYDRALSDGEREQVEGYLTAHHLGP